MHTDYKDEREQDGPDDLGELAQRQNTDENPGPLSTTINPRGISPRSCAAALGSVTPAMCQSVLPPASHRSNETLEAVRR